MRLLVTALPLICFMYALPAVAQPADHPVWKPVAAPAGTPGRAFIMKSAHSMFPDTARQQGYSYQQRFFDAAKHYSDSSVFVFVPDYFDSRKPYDVVIWFHGWYNTIDSSLSRFRLAGQFYGARKNAVFLLPEGPKNAPDSYGGKWEDPSEMAACMADAVYLLQEERIMPMKAVQGYVSRLKHVTLAGHSGAYRVMAKNSRYARQILLFDGLYGQLDAYLEFAKDSINEKRLVHIYTNDGGTLDHSRTLMRQLDSLGIGYLHRQEDEVSLYELATHRIVFLHSRLGHDDVVTNRNNFERLLATKKD